MNLEQMAIDHPYYCSDNNYFSREATATFETMTDFLDEFEDADIDMNLVFRWDIHNRSEDYEGASAGRYYAEVFIMGQRKGLFRPCHIKHINEAELERFIRYLKRHWETLQMMWEPISAQPPEVD